MVVWAVLNFSPPAHQSGGLNCAACASPQCRVKHKLLHNTSTHQCQCPLSAPLRNCSTGCNVTDTAWRSVRRTT